MILDPTTEAVEPASVAPQEAPKDRNEPKQRKDRKERKDSKVGVVFVHGVGNQPRSATLRENATPLLEWLHEWHDRRHIDGFKLVASRLSYGDERKGPPRVWVEIPAALGDSAQSWVLSEAWWAGRLVPPSMATLLAWARSAIFQVAKRLIKMTFLRKSSIADRGFVFGAIITVYATFQLVVYVLGLLVLLPIVVVLLLVSQLPIPRLEQFIVFDLIRPLLTEGIGDYHVYLNDDIQALHVRGAVTETIRWLVQHEHCRRVVVVAHSGGAVVAYDALGCTSQDAAKHRAVRLQMDQANPSSTSMTTALKCSCRHDVRELDKVDGLLTFGGAIDSARADDRDRHTLRLHDWLCPHITWIDVWATYDPVAAGKVTTEPRPDVNAEVTNALEVLKDHDGYFTNSEEFTQFLASVIDRPRDPLHSRFFTKTEAWWHRREERLIALTVWRLWSVWTFSFALYMRVIYGRLESDGDAVIRMLSGTPFIREIATPLVAAFDDAGAGTVVRLYTAVALWVAACLAAHVTITRAVFDPWSRRAGRHSAGPVAPTNGQMLAVVVRSVLVLTAISLVACAIAATGILIDAGSAVAFVSLLLGAWWLCWAIAAREGSSHRAAAVPVAVPAE